MKYKIAVFSTFVGIAIGSFCIGQGKPTVKSQVASDVKISDHESIEKLQVEVAELQEKLAALTQTYNTHTHPLRSLEVARIPGSIECDQAVVQWSSTGVNRESVNNVCRQRVSGDISVLVPGKESIAIGPPRP
jgi:hypothetical protein